VFVVGAVQLVLTAETSVAVREEGVASGLLLAVLGTTIVPYNFFLAAGLGVDSDLGSMRRGLALSFGVGALITSAIVVVGTVAGAFVGFDDLAVAISGTLGPGGGWIVGIGLFAAGISSATTAPLAAAVAGRELIGTERGGKWFKSTWLLVLLTGLAVTLIDLDLVGVIVVAQVINGLLLPFIALVIMVLANREALLGVDTNRWWQNLLGGGVLLFVFYKTGEFFYDLVV
jgi:Mn2+/Fe2+ NRAMP family transporter